MLPLEFAVVREYYIGLASQNMTSQAWSSAKPNGFCFAEKKISGNEPQTFGSLESSICWFSDYWYCNLR